MRRLVFASACAAVSALTVHAAAQGASARLAYDAANLALNGGEGYQTADNKTGTLAWGEAYIMMSYAAMYRATNDAAYLVNLASHARSVLDHRDSVLGWKDYAGNSRPCWQSTKYSDNQEPVCWVVHSGMITYPMADLARIVAKDPALQALPVPGAAPSARLPRRSSPPSSTPSPPTRPSGRPAPAPAKATTAGIPPPR